MVRFFNPSKWYVEHKEEMDSEIQRVLGSGDLILREDVEKFETKFAQFVGKKYAVGLNSGTDALYLALWALGIGQGDKVIVPSHTFVATLQVVNQLGATPVLVDIGENWKKHLSKKVKALIPAHITGKVLQWETDLPMIDDSAQALGAIGATRGLVQCYSFYPAKILGAYGDAGAITTDDEGLANEIRELRNHYKKDYTKWGINSRLDNLQAAVLNVKLKYLPQALTRRREIAERYLEQLQGVGLPENTYGRVWQDFVIQTEKRDELFDYLKEGGIETMKNEYPFPIKKLPKSVKYESETLRIPCNENLTDLEVSEIIEKINVWSTRESL